MQSNRRFNRHADGAGMMLEDLEARTLLAAVKIMPLGDSITETFPGHASYRFFLYNQLKNAGYDIDFVGSLTGVNGGAPLYSNFDQNHEGHSGITTDQIQSNIINWANLNKPDIVLLHTGSNDVELGQSNSSTITELSGLIDNLRSVVPNVKILLAQVIPETGHTAEWPDLNSRIATLASQKTTTDSPITLVDQYTGFNASADTFDGIHPNESGERKMSAKWFSALTGVLPSPTQPNLVYLSDLNATSSSNGWGSIEKDRSNGEQGSNDGKTIALNGIGYLKGLGVHAGSDTTYNIAGGTYSAFSADVGVDDEAGNNGSVVFQVYVDGQLKYTSPRLTGSSTTQQVSVPLASNNTTLRLVVTDSGDGGTFDHGDWANARLTLGAPVSAPNAPSGLSASFDSSTNQIGLSWTDNASDELGFRIERKAGAGGSYSQIAEIGADQTSYTDTSTLSIGTTYFYRVLAFKNGATSGFSNEASAAVTAPPGTTFVSDLNPSSQSNGWGPMERDRSNGEQGATDGRTLTLNGVTYARGLGVHAQSDLTYDIAGAGFTQFQSDIGIDDEVGNNGSVFFQVYLGNTLVYSSPRMTGSSATVPVSVAIPGDATTLRLLVTTDGDATFDHADWANAQLVAGPVVPAPAAPTSLSATYNTSTTQIDLQWTDNADDETGYRVERKTGAGGTWSQIASLAADSTTYSDNPAQTIGTTYFYRVYAVKTGAPNSATSNEANATIPAPAGTTYASDLPFTVNANGWGTVEKDHSNGEQGATDGRTITLNGVTYAKGLGAHAASDITFNISGLNFTSFQADIGVDDEAGNNGSVVFQVYLGNSLVYTSPRMTGSSATQQVSVVIPSDATTLRLVVNDSGDGNTFDHADWADARFLS
jgi:lysophospholipase L1-like esterase